MKTRRLVALRPHKYGTRHLTAGEEYEAPPRHAIALVAARRARFADKGKYAKPTTPKKLAEPSAPAAPPPESKPVVAATSEVDKLEALRLEAERLGVSVDGRWGIARLQHEIAQARR
jgi:hypothetical protein